MALTLGFTSMDKATETALRAAFSKANETLQDGFTLADDSDAEFVIIDMDSMYGPMGWLRLHAAGKQVVGLTAAARTQADFRLGRPFDTEAMVELLRQLASSADVELGDMEPGDGPAAKSPPTPEPVPAKVPEPAPEAASPAVPQPEPPGPGARTDPAGKTWPEAATGAQAPGAGEVRPSPPDISTRLAKPAAEEPGPDIATDPEPASGPPLRDPVFADWMQPGALSGRLRYHRGTGPELWIDADARQYHGPQQLKPLADHFHGTVERGDFEAVDDDAWSAGIADAGEAQPMARLQWLGGLLAGNGALLPGHDPEGRYQLTKWPQTEREYPRHFRIATAMMKGPATLAEVAEASGASLAEVADFTNANLATGYAGFVPEPESEPEPPPRPTGFFSRLRGRS